jgi:uncharacterized protein with PQ loop repeat
MLIPYVKKFYLDVRSQKKKIITSLILISSLGILVFLLYSYVPFIESLVEQSLRTDEKRVSGTGVASFIFTLPWYLRYPSKLLFTIVKPYPTFGSLPHMFQGMGTFVQLIFTPVAFYGAIKALKIKNLQNISVWFFFFLLLVGLGSVDFKHKPTILLFGSFLVVYGLRYFKVNFYEIRSKLL